jgi:hypothetical protein
MEAKKRLSKANDVEKLNVIIKEYFAFFNERATNAKWMKSYGIV